MSLDGEWGGEAYDAIVVTIPLGLGQLRSDIPEDQAETLIDLVVGQAARKAREAAEEFIKGPV